MPHLDGCQKQQELLALRFKVKELEDDLRKSLRMSSYQQSALAELAELCAAVKRHQEVTGEFATSEKFTDQLNGIVEKRVSINWGEVYDKLHRSGANL